jgi:beta-galactosidase
MKRRNAVCLLVAAMLAAVPAYGQEKFTAPATPRVTYNFNPGWKFMKEESPGAIAGAEAAGFDDSKWADVATPHSFNETDSFRTIISHGGGDRGTWKGTVWYRKHFTVPAGAAGQKVFLEFEGMRQAADIYLNGKQVGLYENGVTPYGIDLTAGLNAGGDNVLAVHLDNRTTYKEKSSGTNFEWNANDFNPDHGGINRPVWLHVMGPIHQTLPLFYGLQTTGVYVHAGNFDIGGKKADVTVESQVANESGERATAGLTTYIVDAQGVVRAKFDADPVDMVAGEKTVVQATGALSGARFWSPEDPYLYKVYTVVTVDGKPVDVAETTTGFRKTAFKGGAGTGGVYINDKPVYLTGFAQRSSNEWAGLGGGYPAWLHDYTAKMIRDDHANYVRWMHVSPQVVDVQACDKFGIVEVCPAGDKERDVQGRQWEQRLEVMKAAMVYHRNSPSILFWEAGNTVVTPEHMQQMVAIRKDLDPEGGRVMGTRGDSNNAANSAISGVAEYYGVMIGQDRGTEGLKGEKDIFRGFSAERRDRAPIIETEDFRDEAGRRFWDDYSPPHFGFKKGTNDTYAWNQETFAIASIERWTAYWDHRIFLKDPEKARWAGYASIYFSDSNADGRQDSSEVARVSGKVDAVRLPKEIYFAHQVMQNSSPQVHIIGHWTYPEGTKKTMYVVANTPSVELLLNGKSIGKSDKPVAVDFDRASKVAGIRPREGGGFLFAFENVAFTPGTLRAVGMKGGEAVASYELKTAGPAAGLKLTPSVSPQGLVADGEDVALFDVEAVDANGERCPTDEARVDFEVSGPAVWRGGYNSGLTDSTNNSYVLTECGINRVAIRATTTAGAITVTAKREGLKPATATVASKGIEVKGGLSKEILAGLPSPVK